VLEAWSLQCPNAILQGQCDLPGHDSTAAIDLSETKLACLNSSWELGPDREPWLVEFCFAKSLLQLRILSTTNPVCRQVTGSELPGESLALRQNLLCLPPINAEDGGLG